MYINTKMLSHYKITLTQFAVLSILRQNKFEDVSELLKSYNGDLDVLNELGCVEEVKAKNKSEEVWKRLRCSKKGQEIIDNISTAEIDEDDLKLFDWLESVYKSMGKEVGNKRKCKNYIAQFKVESGITKNHLAFLCQSFINDESQMEFSNKLEFVFFKSANLFSTKFDIYQSRLFQYLEKNRGYFEQQFSKINNG